MKVAVFHNQPVPPRDYGGTERVCAWLCQGLIEAGHEVVLLSPDSRRWNTASSSIRFESWAKTEDTLIALRRRLSQVQGLELLHSMVPLPEEFERSIGVPVVTTIHGNGRPGEKFGPWSVFVSKDHARRHGHERYVWNGLDPSEFDPSLWESEASRQGMTFLAKTSWRVKNLAGAARLCARAGVALSIAGGDRPLRIRLEAFLRKGWRWHGRVAGAEKARILSSSRGFLFPVRWPEPFGLVVAEALFSGTPVLATPMGSLPELLTPEVGVLQALESSQDEAAWVEIIQAVSRGERRFSPEACRAYALQHFHYRVMTERYLRVYRERLSSG